jgi:DNA repair protein RadC
MPKPQQVTQNKLSDTDQEELLKLPLHTSKEIQSYLKPGEGFERVAPIALALLASHPEIAAALKIDAAALTAEHGRGLHLATRSAIAQNLERRADESRLEAESDVYRALLKVNRFVQNAEDVGLEQEFAKLSEWIASTHGGATRPAAPAAAPVAADEKKP